MEKPVFTKEEITMLRAIFKGAEAAIEARREDNYDVYEVNILHSIKEKLGIYDIIEAQTWDDLRKYLTNKRWHSDSY